MFFCEHGKIIPKLFLLPLFSVALEYTFSILGIKCADKGILLVPLSYWCRVSSCDQSMAVVHSVSYVFNSLLQTISEW